MVKTRSVRGGNSSQPLGRGQVPSNLPPHPPPPILNTLPRVDHAEGGDKNQPHNSAYNSTSTANQDVVATQLADMQQQFGVFQLVLAQLLARNNPGDPLINLLNPAPQPPAPQQNPGPVPHAPAISESQGQSQIAPVQQPLHDDVTRRLDSLEKLVAEQRGNARTWYYSLSPRSISFYTELASAFATKFSSRRLIKKTTSELMRVKQRDRESLKNFMSKFNDVVLEVNSFDQAVGITAVISGLSHERFRDSLLKHPATTFNEVNDRSLKFITTEEYALSQNPIPIKNQHSHWRDEDPNRKRMKTTPNRGPMPTSTSRFGRQNLAPPQQSAVVTPHNDPLVTSVLINNCEVQCVLVDTGSAPDIMYFHCFESLGLDLALLQKYDGPIYDFNNQPIPVEGVLTMNVAFGSGRTYVTPSIRFLVVKMASSFNVVIGRPTLTEIRAVVSQSHLCMKFPTPMGIPTLQEDETRATPVEDVEEVHIDDRDPSRTMQIGTKLNPGERAELIAFLRANKDVFAWTSADMPGIPTSVSQHKLSTNPLKKPVAQKRRLFGGERLKVIKEEVEKLLQAGFVRRVDYCEWVANPVLVKKANGKWWMCIDYTNLNDACPKDCYPMPNIDKLVEAALRNERLSLLDAYSGYHQVPMAPKDEEKTSFYAGDEIYCYVMMPFDLKNAGATYQKMVTIVFRAQIGKNLEVYVDDIVVKSLKAEDHLTDLEETFNNLKKNIMRLNLVKCIFGVESGKFLGFMMSRRGIEVNLEKIKAVAEMEPPKSVKDIQRLTRRVAALHRFISKSADKCLPFFKIMRSVAQKDESGKQKKFEWSQECQTAFDELKSYLSSPPLLTKVVDEEILYLYLGISDEAISSVLVREEAKQQKPIYYINGVLHGAEKRYPLAEKAALAVVTSARTLRSAIRAQALADFIVECTPCHSTPNLEPNEWTLYVDGAFSSKGSGAGALLIGPNGYRSEHALKFNFDATNNMAEYEALLLGLQLALELKINAIQVYSDSQLVVNQINSLCEVVDSVMMKYVALVAELKCRFQRFCLSKIPWAENEQADSLSKFASDSSLSSRSVFVEVLDAPSFTKPQVMEISTDPGMPSWTDSIVSFLRDGVIPEEKQEAMKLRKKASRYTLVDGVLYKRSFSLLLRRCLNPYEVEYALKEVHEGVCGSHVGPRTLAHKVLRQGYYWPNMYKDATQFVQRCQKCQLFAHLIHQPAEELTTLVAPWPFAQWVLDLLGPFMKGFTSVYHPKSNGMVESVNKCILEGIKPRLEQHKAKWANELNNVLSAYRTTSRTATGETPYHLAFGTKVVIPIEIGVQSFRVTHFNEERNGQLLRENLDLLDEIREEARLRTLLAPNWEGPYTMAEVPHSSVYILQDTEGKRVPRVWNVNNLKKFYP
ncbi:hypothetical protein SLEP1_g56910 [Rubroshorea leprosula]|uniref:RNase H type-1 domain-containing protein n=1 Tax=Rubroshorea leprosula TaxID=152421 RepID=A0AAV5MNM2_9ROSI|nr:hypothetical protein SLEP1_g56910 [Rubroshorea leprosula]